MDAGLSDDTVRHPTLRFTGAVAATYLREQKNGYIRVRTVARMPIGIAKICGNRYRSVIHRAMSSERLFAGKPRGSTGPQR